MVQPMVSCMAMGRISHTDWKSRMVICGIATSKNHIELLLPHHAWVDLVRPAKKAYSAAALFGETNFGRKAAKFGRAQNQRPKIRHGVEPSCAL
jgi:hypothetical protein